MDKQRRKQDFLSLFRKEAEIHIQELGKGLLALESDPQDRTPLEEIRRRAHTLKGAAKMMGLTAVNQAAHSMEDILEGIRMESSELDKDTFDKLFLSLDSIKALLEGGGIGETAKKDEETSEAVKTPIKDAGTIEYVRPQNIEPAVQDAILVETNKLDSLAGIVSEMAMTQIKSDDQETQISRIANSMREQFQVWTQIKEKISPNPAIESKDTVYKTRGLGVEQINNCHNRFASILNSMIDLLDDYRRLATHRKLLMDQLQDDIRSIRLIPISVAFDAFPRAVRDMSREYGKEIKLNISGGEAKLDKSIIETIKDPLMHLMRNAVDHGIEKPAERLRRGKPKIGTINLSAYHRGSRVVIEISDDGLGIDLEKVKQTALQKGRIEESQFNAMDEESAIQLIFLPGISTSPMITDVSGRGVGMDVVMQNISRKLKGTVDVQTEQGKGTRISLAVPITLAVMRVLLVKAGYGLFAIPTDSIKRNVKLPRDRIKSVEGKQILIENEEIIPLVRLSEILGTNGTPEEYSNDAVSVFITEYGQRPIGFCIDRFVGEQEVVIKSLGNHLKRIPHIVGATVLGTGEVVAILHISDLVNSARNQLAGATISQQSAADQEKQKSQKMPSILVVDDSLTTRELERSILEASGYDVYIAVDGVDGFNKVSERQFDLIISDVEMPRMDGFQMVEKLKQSEHSKNIPVIMVTALQKEEEKRRGMEVGASAYIVKSSFDQSNLLDTIQTLIG